jgi:Xaa-Pro aminopeptidase
MFRITCNTKTKNKLIQNNNMKYEQIDSKLFIENREKFKQQMKPNSIALFSSNYEYVLNGDATHTFKQNSNLFWL